MESKRYYLYHIFVKINRYLTREENSGVTPGEFGVLWTIWNSEKQALHPSVISKRMGIARPSLTPLLRNLEELGMIERQTDAYDGRKYLIGLTEKCREKRDLQTENQKDMFDKLIGTLTAQELEQLLSILHKMEECLEKYESQD